MNFELADKLNEFLKDNKLEKAIDFAENELRQLPESAFHQALGKDLNHLTSNLSKYLTDFLDYSQRFYKGTKKGFLQNIFKTQNDTDKSLKAIYCEMNGFTINYDLWFIDLFGFSFCNDLTDLDWLADFEYSSEKSMTITGLESLQKVYQDYMDNEKWKDKELEKASDICEFLIILRLQQLFKQTYIEHKDKQSLWTEIPIFVTAHDYDLVYKTK